MKNSKLAAIVAATIGFTLGNIQSASATESGFYVGLNFGTSTFDVDEDTIPNVEIDDTDSTWSLAAGYRFNPFVGLEISHVDLGETHASLDYTYFGPARIDVYGRAKGTALALVTALPINAFEFNLRLGVLFAENEIEYVDRYLNVVDREIDDASTEELLFGLGAGYTFNDHFFVKGEWTRYDDVGDEEVTGEGNVDTLTVGFAYRF